MRRLTEKMIKAGEDLVRVLHQAEFPLRAALWVYFSELEDWRMYLVIPGIRAEGRRKFYRRISSLTRNESKFPVEFHPRGTILGKYFDDAHVYPLPEGSRRRRREVSSVG